MLSNPAMPDCDLSSYCLADHPGLYMKRKHPMSVQAIAGVSPGTESRVMAVFPSIAATAPGMLLGQLYDCLPVRIFGVKLSSLLFALPTAPIGALIFLLTKATGKRYVLTNRSLQVWTSLGSRRISSIPLSEIGSVTVEQLPGQVFFRAADIRIKAANGQTLLVLPGVPDFGSFKNAIECTLRSHRLVKSSMDTINARRS
jgi:hypothetical protein